MFSSDGGVSYTHWCYATGGQRYDGSNYNSVVLLPRQAADADNEHRLMTAYYNGSVLATFVRVTIKSDDIAAISGAGAHSFFRSRLDR